jgi:hypothetical protein
MAITILIALFLILLYVLMTPFIFTLRYETGGNQAITRVQFFPFDFRSKHGKKKKPGSGMKFQIPGKLLRDEFDTVSAVVFQLIDLCGRVLKSTDRYYLNILLKGGLGSPDLTGEAYGAIESVKPILGQSVAIEYQPDFMAESVQGTIVASLRVRTIHVLKDVLRCVWKLPKLKLIKIMYASRKGGRDVRQA